MGKSVVKVYFLRTHNRQSCCDAVKPKENDSGGCLCG